MTTSSPSPAPRWRFTAQLEQRKTLRQRRRAKRLAALSPLTRTLLTAEQLSIELKTSRKRMRDQRVQRLRTRLGEIIAQTQRLSASSRRRSGSWEG